MSSSPDRTWATQLQEVDGTNAGVTISRQTATNRNRRPHCVTFSCHRRCCQLTGTKKGNPSASSWAALKEDPLTATQPEEYQFGNATGTRIVMKCRLLMITAMSTHQYNFPDVIRWIINHRPASRTSSILDMR